jgi:predicted aldo/keto reductase-like oxidoreductase
LKYRKLGSTNLKVSVVGIGGGAFAGPDKNIETVKKIVRYCTAKGVNLIETAEDYDESKLATALNHITKKVVLISKSFAATEKDMKKALTNSLKKLKVNYIDIYMLHTVTTVEGFNYREKMGALKALEKARKDGIIGFIGITSHSINVVHEILKKYEFDVVEIPYCIGMSDTDELIESLANSGVGIIGILPLGGGILVDRLKGKAYKLMNAENALKFVLSNENIATTLVGMSTLSHAKENIEIINSGISLSSKKRKELETKVKKFLGEKFCRGCKACMPCDIYGWKFGIDTILRMETFYFKYGMKSVLNDYANLKLKANVCTKCGGCELRCPYKVPIMNKLAKFHQLWERLKKVSRSKRTKYETI